MEKLPSHSHGSCKDNSSGADNTTRIIKHDDTTPGVYAAAEAWSEQSRKIYFSRKPSSISDEPGAYAAAEEWTKNSTKAYYKWTRFKIESTLGAYAAAVEWTKEIFNEYLEDESKRNNIVIKCTKTIKSVQNLVNELTQNLHWWIDSGIYTEVLVSIFALLSDLVKNHTPWSISPGEYAAAVASTEKLRSDFIATRTLWGISPGEYAAAVAWTEKLRSDFMAKIQTIILPPSEEFLKEIDKLYELLRIETGNLTIQELRERARNAPKGI